MQCHGTLREMVPSTPHSSSWTSTFKSSTGQQDLLQRELQGTHLPFRRTAWSFKYTTMETQFFWNQHLQHHRRVLQPTMVTQEYDEKQMTIFTKGHERDGEQTIYSHLHLRQDHETQRGMNNNFNEHMSSGGLTTRPRTPSTSTG